MTMRTFLTIALLAAACTEPADEPFALVAHTYGTKDRIVLEVAITCDEPGVQTGAVLMRSPGAEMFPITWTCAAGGFTWQPAQPMPCGIEVGVEVMVFEPRTMVPVRTIAYPADLTKHVQISCD